VFWKYPTAGVKTAESPWTAQRPGIGGESVGIGELADSGAENWTRMGVAPLTPRAPAAGVTDITWRAAGGSCGFTAAVGAAGDTGAAWLPGDANATTMTPAARTSTALLAVTAAPRRLDRAGTLEVRVLGQIRLAAEVPLVASDVRCLRNHPDPDTAPSPPRDFTIEKSKDRNSRCRQDQITSPSSRQTRTRRKRLPISADPVRRRERDNPAPPALLTVTG
jgi:hypothetical protein